MVVRVLNEFLIEVSEQINVNFDDELDHYCLF